MKCNYNVNDKSEITPSEYLATLRVLHILQRKYVKENNGVVSKEILHTLQLVELHAPYQLKNIVNLLYNS